MRFIGKHFPAELSRTGHGAASVIPYLNDPVPLEPSQLGEPEDIAGEGDPAPDRQDTIAITG